jgi:hypothetical protein
MLKDIDIEDKLCVFIKDFGDDLNSLELLVFFCRHPRVKFNRIAVVHALLANQFDAGIALKRLIDKKIIITNSENGITLYSLTKEEPVNSLAPVLVNIDQNQWQNILVQILKAQGIQ